jgi:hypothetical protein
MKFTVEICIENFMKFGIGVQGILRFILSNLKGCYIGSIDGRDL